MSGFGIGSQGREGSRAVATLTLLGKGSPARPHKERGGARSEVAAAERFDVSTVKWVSKK